jgi:cytosine/adenosine deaminase-related metal-dependent hydrolase/ubiquinone/menaquinone biosynthesis C-methylase UbiE
MESTIQAISAFDAWADVYDAQPNPLLALEQRVLGPMLPDVRGLDVLDAGCGTGRWLTYLAERAPRSLTGVDVSEQMLAAAGRKLGKLCDRKLGSCAALPVADESVDLMLSSFVLSYVDDLEASIAEAARVMRPGGRLFLCDMHPDTERMLGWRRTFAVHGAETVLHSQNWSLAYIVEMFQRRGLRLVSRNEPLFGLEERAIFTGSGKDAQWASLCDFPAIYVLEWRKPASAPRLRRTFANVEGLLTLRGARWASGPNEAEPVTLSIVNNRIQAVESQRWSAPAGVDLDLSGRLLLPGLINAHDHLEFGLFPRLGNGPYQNASQWAKDIHVAHADTIARLRKVPRATAIWWGGIRNLLCGATTVCHHNPLHPEMTEGEFPVRVVEEFAWAHSFGFEPQVWERFAGSDPALPFILHAAEGIDKESAREIFALDEMRVLSDRTVLVHALACTAEGIALLNQRRATIVACPTSNQFLFHRSLDAASMRALRSVILGSDSPLTAAGDLLDEIRFAHQHIGLDAEALYRMVTTQAARVLHLRRGQGTLAPGAVADILVVRDSGFTPAESLVRMTIESLDLVIVGGRIQLASQEFMSRLPFSLTGKLEAVEIDGLRFWIRAPITELLATAEHFLGRPRDLAGKRVSRVAAA